MGETFVDACPNERLLAAVQSRSLDAVRAAIEQGSDANAALGKGQRALFIAASNGDVDIAKFLVAKGADIHATHPQGVGNALFYAASVSNNREMIAWLVDEGISINTTRRFGATPLHRAGKVMNMEDPEVMADIILTMELMLNKGADINAVYRFQGSWTPLRDAIFNNLTPVVAFLLERGADVRACDEGVNGLLLDAVENANIQVASWLVERGANVNASLRGAPIIFAAAQKDSLDMLRWLVDKGAKLDVADKSGNTVAHCAAANNAVAVLEYLLTQGINLNARNELKKTCLHVAASTSSDDAVKFLLTTPVNVNAVCKRGHTPIFEAMFPPTPPEEMADATYQIIHALSSHGGRLPTLNVLRTIKRPECLQWQLGLLECARQWQIQYANGLAITDVEEESIQRGPSAVRAYLSAMGSTTADQLVYRRKICIVGPSEWGKTSLVKSLTSERPSLVHIDDRTIGIDLFACEFDNHHETQSHNLTTAPTAVEHHEVTFWDFAGQDVYQVAHALFFSPRTLYMVCVNLEAYSAALDQATAAATRQSEQMMHRFVTQNILRWLRLIFTRQPDAQFVFVGTKVDRLANEHVASVVWQDLRSRMFAWKRDMMKEIEEAFEQAGHGASGASPTMLPDELTHVRRQERDTKLSELEAKLDAIIASECLLSSSADEDAVASARSAIESVIIRSDRSYKMPRLYSQVLEAIKKRRVEAAHFARAKDRVTEMIIPFSSLYSWLAREIDGLDADSFVQIVRALHDIGDILWYEKETSVFKNLIILDPTIVVDYVKEVVNHTHVDSGAANTDGRLTHEMLSELRFWKDSDEDLTYAFKLLLQHYQLAHPADSKDMEWDSDLIVPAYWKSQEEPTHDHDHADHSAHTRDLGDKTVCVRWEYELTAELSETVFDHFAVQSYSSTLERCVWCNCIESSDENEFVSRVELQRNDAARDVIRIDVYAADAETAWRSMRFSVMAMEEVLDDYPGLFVSRYIVSNDADCHMEPQWVRHRVSDAVSALEHSVAAGRDIDALRASMPWLPEDMAWYIEKAWRTPGKLQEIRQRSSVSQMLAEVEVVKRLVVTRGSDTRSLPALWTAVYDDEKKRVAVKMLSDVSGACFHDPLVIDVPSKFMADHASALQVGVSVMSNVLPELLLPGIVSKAINFALSAVDEKTKQAKSVRCLINSPVASPSTTASSNFSLTDGPPPSPRASMALLRKLLALYDPEFDELRISDLCKLECATTKEGKFVWASRKEIEDPKNDLTPCDPVTSTTTTSISQADCPSDTSMSTTAAPFKLRLTFNGAMQLPTSDWRRAYCTWKLINPKECVQYASGRTGYNPDKTKPPSWYAVGFSITTVPSLEVLRECRLIVKLKRPSRWQIFEHSLGRGKVRMGEYLEDPAGVTLAVEMRDERSRARAPPYISCTIQVVS